MSQSDVTVYVEDILAAVAAECAGSDLGPIVIANARRLMELPSAFENPMRARLLKFDWFTDID